MLIEKFCDEGKLQTLLISHHPEVIDYLALSCGYSFSSHVHAPTRVKRVKTDKNSGLPISELISHFTPNGVGEKWLQKSG